MSTRAGVLALRERSKIKLGHLKKVPYLFASLDQRDVAQEIIDQWTSVPDKSKHHRVTRALMEDDVFLQDLQRVADGGSASAALMAQRASFAAMLMDDGIAESPHAIAAKVGAHAHSSRWPFDSSTMRLADNIKDKKC